MPSALRDNQRSKQLVLRHGELLTERCMKRSERESFWMRRSSSKTASLCGAGSGEDQGEDGSTTAKSFTFCIHRGRW